MRLNYLLGFFILVILPVHGFCAAINSYKNETEKIFSSLTLSNSFAVAPEAIDVKNFPVQNIASRTQILPLIGRDTDGNINSFKILSLPSVLSGKLYLNNVLVAKNQIITLAQAKQLQFEVVSTFTGNALFTYTAIDVDLLEDLSPATFTIPIVNNASALVCTGGVLGDNILGNRGTFSSPFIVPTAGSNCVNNGLTASVNPPQNVGQAHPELTNYKYVSGSGGLGPEGTYSFLKTIGTMAAKNCIKGDWVGSDHSGDGGYFMVVNGSPKVGTYGKTFYSSKSQPVCPNTLYEFSAYVINVLPGSSGSAIPGSEPNISFYINNQLVSTSGSIKYSDASTGFAPQWVKVGGLWYSGPNTSVDLQIDNATFVASGNDLGLDDISMAICGPEITYPDNDLNPKFCEPGILPLSAKVKSSINTYSSYIFEVDKGDGIGWQNLSSSPQTGSPELQADGSYVYDATYGDIPISFNMNGYKYRLKVATEATNLDGTTCNIAATKVIKVGAIQYPDAGPDVSDCTGINSYKLNPANANETWYPDPANPALATISQAGQVSGMTINGEYKFYLKNSIDCTDYMTIFRFKINDPTINADKICNRTDYYSLPVAEKGYTWVEQPGNPSPSTIDQTTGVVNGLINTGNYEFILKSDFTDCTKNFQIHKLDPVVLMVDQSIEICEGTSVDITSGITNYDPTTYKYEILDPSGNLVSAPFMVNTAGDYQVTVEYKVNSCLSATEKIKLIIHPKPGSPTVKIN